MNVYNKLTLEQKLKRQEYHKRWRDLRRGVKKSIFEFDIPPPIRPYNRKNKFISQPAVIIEQDTDSNNEDTDSEIEEDTNKEFINTPFKKKADLLELEFECLLKMKNKGIDTQEKAELFLSNVNQVDLKNSLKQFELRTPANIKAFLINVMSFL